MQLMVNITLSDADAAAYNAATPDNAAAFALVKLIATQSEALQTAIANTDIISMLQPADQAAIEALIAVAQAMPKVGA